MDFEPSAKAKDYIARLTDFMDAHVYPAEPVYAEQLAGLRAELAPTDTTEPMDLAEARVASEAAAAELVPDERMEAALAKGPVQALLPRPLQGRNHLCYWIYCRRCS